MKIVSTTITGNNEDIIADALRSVVDWVDTCLIVDTGVTDKTLDIAREVCGDKFFLTRFAWPEDFSLVRNFALDQAARHLAKDETVAHDNDWAVTVDTDERLHVDGKLLRDCIECSDSDVLQMECVDNYAKDRFFRIPTKAAWIGSTHEYLAYEGGKRGHLNGEWKFSELPKTRYLSMKKFTRDIGILHRLIEKGEKDPRWKFYLGESYKNFGDPAAAIRWYHECSVQEGWLEQRAFARFRIAECCFILKRYEETIEHCLAGMSIDAGYAEFPWLMGNASFQLGKKEQAVYFSKMALGLGYVKKILFRDKRAYAEGPHDTLRFALKDIGDTAGAMTAEREYQERQLL